MPNKKNLDTIIFQLEVKDDELFLGDELKGTLRIASNQEFDIERIWVNLRCQEIVKEKSAVLYEDNVQISGNMQVGVGFKEEFPFAIKLPFIGRETFDSIDHSIQWLVYANVKVRGTRDPLRADGSGYILVANRKEPFKEIVKEVVLIPCSYCGGLMPQTSVFCPNCGARRKT